MNELKRIVADMESVFADSSYPMTFVQHTGIGYIFPRSFIHHMAYNGLRMQ